MPQCQFLFSAVFVFQKSQSGNILGIGRNLDRTSYFSNTYTESKGETEGSHEAATPWGRAGPPCRAVGWCGPHGRLQPPPFRLFIHPDAKTLNTRAIIHEKFQRRRRRQPQLGRVQKLFPALCRRGESSPEGSTSPCLPPE